MISKEKFLTILINILIVLLSQSSLLFAQADSILYEEPTWLDYVAINNKPVNINQEGVVEIKKSDVIKISGISKPDTNVKVSVQDEEYKATVDTFGNWFVLFSVKEDWKNIIPINAEIVSIEGIRESRNIFSLKIEDSEAKEVSLKSDNTKDSSNRLFKSVPLVTMPLTFVIAGLLGWYIGHTNKVKIKRGK